MLRASLVVVARSPSIGSCHEICGKTIHGFCTTIMHLLILHCLFVNFWPKQYYNDAQPPYSADMAPCDFFLFPKIKRTLKGRRFTAIDDIKSASLKELKAIPKIEFEKCFEDWKMRWHKCIISNGDCFEGDNINVDEYINIFFKKRKFPLFSEHTSYVDFFDQINHFLHGLFSREGSLRIIFFSNEARLRIFPSSLPFVRYLDIYDSEG